LQAGRALISKLVDDFPGWSQWENDLAWFDAQIDALNTASGSSEA
jgi:hypothetical protein